MVERRPSRRSNDAQKRIWTLGQDATSRKESCLRKNVIRSRTTRPRWQKTCEKHTDEVGNKTTWKILKEEMKKRLVWFVVGSGGGPQDQTCSFARRTLALWVFRNSRTLRSLGLQQLHRLLRLTLVFFLSRSLQRYHATSWWHFHVAQDTEEAFFFCFRE